MYIYIYIYIHVYVYIYIYVYIYTYLYIHVCMIYIHIFINCIHTYICRPSPRTILRVRARASSVRLLLTLSPRAHSVPEAYAQGQTLIRTTLQSDLSWLNNNSQTAVCTHAARMRMEEEEEKTQAKTQERSMRLDTAKAHFQCFQVRGSVLWVCVLGV